MRPMGTKSGERGVMRMVSRREGEQGEHCCEAKKDEYWTSRSNIAGEKLVQCWDTTPMGLVGSVV